MAETYCASAVLSNSMWQATQQYQYNMPPQRDYNGPYVQQPFLYPQFSQQLQPQTSTSYSHSYYGHPQARAHHHHQQQQQQQLRQYHQRRQSQPKTAAAAATAPPQPQQPESMSALDLPKAKSVCVDPNPRANRNAAEKYRRDNLNGQIHTMATLVPAIANGGSRRRDKISILRLAGNHIRMHFTLGQSTKKFLPRKFNNVNLEKKVINHLEGSPFFLIVLTMAGKIIYVSENVEKHLGHDQTDLLGESLFNYVYEQDKPSLKNCLTPITLTELVSRSDSVGESSNSSDDSAITKPDYRKFRKQRRSCLVRVSIRTNSRREAVHYEFLQLSGVLRLASEMMPRRNGVNNPTSNDIIFVGKGMLPYKRSLSDLTHVVQSRNEYFTRHLIDGRIIFCDHRISIVAGYMAQEVSGTSAFKFMHKDDVKWTIVALRHMYDHGTPYGTSCYRLISKTGSYIYLRTHGYLEFDEETKSVTSFICINTLISTEEGEELIADMKKRFSATVNSARAIQGNDSGFDSDTECTSTMSIVPDMDEPEELEQAINDLVSDLPATVNCEEPCPDIQYGKAIAYSHNLPPPSVHASQVGIKDVDNIYFGKGGKGGKGKGAGKGSGKSKGKQSPSTSTSSDSPSDCSMRNCERVSAVGEKRIPELDDPSSPVIADKSTDRPVDKIFVSPNPSESESHSESATVDDDLRSTNATDLVDTSGVSVSYNLQNNVTAGYIQPGTSYVSNLQQVRLKRSYEDDDEHMSSKKTAPENCVTLEIVDVNDFANAEIGFPAYIEVQSTSLGSDLQEVPATFQQIDANSITLASTEGSFIELQEFTGELDTTIANNPEVIKLLTSLPQTITLEGTEEEVNICQYPTSDLRD